jgi:hypothetical protein
MKDIFPWRIYSEILDISDEYNSLLKNEIERLVPPQATFGNVRTTYLLVHTLRNPVFSNLISKIEEEACKCVGFKVCISEFWCTVADQGAYHAIHNHSPQILSGVYYVDAPPGLTLDFFNDKPLIKTCNQYYCEPIETKKLIMFEGWVPHGFAPVPSVEPKIAIAFNFQDCSETLR